MEPAGSQGRDWTAAWAGHTGSLLGLTKGPWGQESWSHQAGQEADAHSEHSTLFEMLRPRPPRILQIGNEHEPVDCTGTRSRKSSGRFHTGDFGRLLRSPGPGTGSQS